MPFSFHFSSQAPCLSLPHYSVWLLFNFYRVPKTCPCSTHAMSDSHNVPTLWALSCSTKAYHLIHLDIVQKCCFCVSMGKAGVKPLTPFTPSWDAGLCLLLKTPCTFLGNKKSCTIQKERSFYFWNFSHNNFIILSLWRSGGRRVLFISSSFLSLHFNSLFLISRKLVDFLLPVPPPSCVRHAGKENLPSSEKKSIVPKGWDGGSLKAIIPKKRGRKCSIKKKLYKKDGESWKS